MDSESSPTPEPSTRNKTRARERHERRKGRQTGMAQPRTIARPQLAPTGGIKIPEVRLPENRILLYGAAAVICILAVIFILGRLKSNNAPQVGTNAIWIGKQYTYEAPDDGQVNSLVQKLRDHQMGTVYAWVSILQPDNTWQDIPKLNQVKSFVPQFKRLYPDAKLYGWLTIGSQGVDGNNRLGDTNMQQIIADFSQRMLAEFKFDGVVLNVVPVSDGDESYLALLRKVRATLGEDASLAVAVPPDWTPSVEGVPEPSQIAPNTYWKPEYKQRIALLANQLIVTAYNSGLNSAEDYSAWMAYQVESFTAAIAELNTKTQILIGVPAYGATLPTHDPAVENAESAVAGINSGLQKAGSTSHFVTGIAVYDEWEMNNDDWSTIKSQWLK